MRRSRTFAGAVLVLLLVACGGGGKSQTTASGSAPNSAGVSAGPSSDQPATDTAGTPSGTDEGGGDQGGDEGGGDQGGGGGGPAPGSNDAPVPPGLKPFGGNYQFHTTGTAKFNGSSQNIDSTDATLVEDINDTDQRLTAGSAQGQQITMLRYSADKVELLSLQIKNPVVNKTFNGPVIFAPQPLQVGQTWDWTLTSTDNLTHVKQASRVDRQEDVTVNGQTVPTFVVETDITFTGDLSGTGHLTSWISPVYKLAVRNHSILDVTYTTFHVNSDTTSDLLDLRPS